LSSAQESPEKSGAHRRGAATAGEVLPRSFLNADVFRHDSVAADGNQFWGTLMVTRTEKKSAASVEERFLLQCLHRLNDENQRYLFTLMVDLLSQGLAASHKKD
jgi:hypothetical protein